MKNCLNCFVPRFAHKATGEKPHEGANCNTIRLMIKEGLNLLCNVMRSNVKAATESAFQKKCKELVDTSQETLKSYAEVIKSAECYREGDIS